MEIKLGISLYFFVVILLIILKVMKVLDIGWLWVFAPLWMPLVFVIIIMVLVLIFAGVIALVAILSD